VESPRCLHVLGAKNNDQDAFTASKNDLQTHNIVDNLQVPREQVLQQRNGPLLESFGKDSMVGEEECVGDDFPGIVPRNLLLIDENAHEFWNGESRMGVVELNGGV